MINKVITKYKNAFENLKVSNIDTLLDLVDENVIFEDPFNKTVGKKKLKKLFLDMFKKLKKPKFETLETYYKKNNAIIKWKFSCILFNRKVCFVGLSEVKVEKGKIAKHLDFWDSGRNFYSNIPLIGRIFRKLHNV